ncbi:hypothetical protein [Leptospira yasudae]|uniref:Uncharacterized protein n=1 Tax=Leptospira yasudae TaxID=2202201 RepID=A0A6N4QTL4_9LEPT|nr:hypothetical protein [Leptospira yasudae]TGL77476.1 hypothetical protein EHQ72_11735 [Leptospira yasudae]TGL82647.1 hypothetical protein EHQ77_03035 [Leptospira yasudae]TGL87989.1 hypothetical protein EHQ83_04345 [Leptospira yasudae]
MKAKNRLRLHSYSGILSILFLTCRIFLPLFTIPFLPEDLYLLLGRIGIFLGLFAFLSGCGLGKYLFVQNSEYTEIHIILLLAGLALQIPAISENHTNFYANLASWFGFPLLLAGWIYGRRIRRKK